jgi:predicted RNA binding protein YcfA (HicA-like mRNA interferase family)
MKVREMIRLLERNGWVWISTTGSHRQFRHSSQPGRVTVSGSMGSEIPVWLEKSMLRQAGMRRRP